MRPLPPSHHFGSGNKRSDLGLRRTSQCDGLSRREIFFCAKIRLDSAGRAVDLGPATTPVRTPKSEHAPLPASSLSAVSPSNLSRWFAEEVQPHESSLRSYLRAVFPLLPDIDDLVQESYARLI